MRAQNEVGFRNRNGVRTMPLLTRRNFLCGAIASVACAGGAFTYARMFEPGWLDVVHVNLPLCKLPDAFADFRIAQLSDLHFGPLVPQTQIASAIDEVLAMKA